MSKDSWVWSVITESTWVTLLLSPNPYIGWWRKDGSLSGLQSVKHHLMSWRRGLWLLPFWHSQMFTLDIDASDVVLGALLLQEHERKERVVAYQLHTQHSWKTVWIHKKGAISLGNLSVAFLSSHTNDNALPCCKGWETEANKTNPSVIVAPLTPKDSTYVTSMKLAASTGRWSYWLNLSGTTQRNKVESFTFERKTKRVRGAALVQQWDQLLLKDSEIHRWYEESSGKHHIQVIVPKVSSLLWSAAWWRTRQPSGKGKKNKAGLREQFYWPGMQITYVCGAKIVQIGSQKESESEIESTSSRNRDRLPNSNGGSQDLFREVRMKMHTY